VEREWTHRVPASERPAQRGSEDVIAWRKRRLTAAAFDEPLARELACNRDVDLHALLELTDRGCPPGLAARIVAPLERAPH
jgi:hypothetical protein